jgi:hypothetical protein
MFVGPPCAAASPAMTNAMKAISAPSIVAGFEDLPMSTT